jgi:hypothetical protein
MEQCLELYQIDPNIFIGNADNQRLFHTLKENNITHVVNITKNTDTKEDDLFLEFMKQPGNYLDLTIYTHHIDDSLNQDLTEFIIKNFHFLDPLIKNEVDNRLTVSKETNVGILIISSNGETEYLLLIKNKKDEKWMIPISEIKEENIVDEEVIKIFKETTGMDFPDYELYDHYNYSYHQFTKNNKNYNILQINIDNNIHFDNKYRIDDNNNKLKWLELDDANLRYDLIPKDYQIISKCLENTELKNKNKSIFELDYQSENTKGAIQTINTEKPIVTPETTSCAKHSGQDQTQKDACGAVDGCGCSKSDACLPITAFDGSDPGLGDGKCVKIPQTKNTEGPIQTENDGNSKEKLSLEYLKESIKKGGAVIENINNKKKAEGDTVEVKLAKWNQYFEGEITKIRSDGTYDIYFPLDKTTEKRVPAEEIKKPEPCSILSFQNSKDCTCPDGARSVHVNIGTKSEGYMCPEVQHNKDNIRNKKKEIKIMFYEKKPFNISFSLISSYYIISQDMKYQEIKEKISKIVEPCSVLTNTNFERQLSNLEKIIHISSERKYKKTLKKKRFTFKKSFKKKYKPNCNELSLKDRDINSNVECTCNNDENLDTCERETSEPKKCCIKSILKKSEY